MAERKEDMRITLRDAQVPFRNLSGRELKYNQLGKRNVTVELSEADATAMMADGWNVNIREPKEDGEERRFFLKVGASWKFKKPRIVMITSRSRVELDEETCGLIDFVDVLKIDMVVRAWWYDFDGNSGWKSEIKSMFVTIDEDELEAEYGVNAIPGAPPEMEDLPVAIEEPV